MKNVLIALEAHRGPLLEGIAEYARRHDWHLSLEMVPNPGNIPWGWDGDGILTMLIRDDTDLPRFVASCAKPTVNLEGRRMATPYPRVLTDVTLAAAMAFDYFRLKGFVNFAFYGYRHSVRGQDFAATVRRHGFECNVLYEWGGSWQGELEITGDWLRKLPKPLAVFCWSDYAGARFVDMARSLGYRVPEDIAVLGMDNDELVCDCTAVRLSSIQTDIKVVGYEGAALLDRLMNGRQPDSADRFIPPREVVERGSTDTLAADSPAVAAAVRFMKSHYADFIKVADVVADVRISRRGLEKAVLAALGKSPRQVLEQIRLDRARVLLRQTDDKVAEIARRVGMSDPKHFSTLFRNSLGLSPRQYRQQWQGPARSAMPAGDK